MVNKLVRIGKLEMIMIDKDQLNAMVDYIKNRGDILAFFIYGSHDTEYQTIFSDVDLAVLPKPGVTFDYKNESTAAAVLSSIGKSDDINLINLNKVPVTLQMEVLETGKLLYCADKLLLSDFIESVMIRYCDFEPDLRSFYQDYDYGLKRYYR